MKIYSAESFFWMAFLINRSFYCPEIRVVSQRNDFYFFGGERATFPVLEGDFFFFGVDFIGVYTLSLLFDFRFCCVYDLELRGFSIY